MASTNNNDPMKKESQEQEIVVAPSAAAAASGKTDEDEIVVSQSATAASASLSGKTGDEEEIVVQPENTKIPNNNNTTDPDIPIASAVVIGQNDIVPSTTTTGGGAITTPTTTASLVSGHKAHIIPVLSNDQEYRVSLKPNVWLNCTADQVVATFSDSGVPVPFRLQGHQQQPTKVAVLDESGTHTFAVLRKNDPTNPDKFHLFGKHPLVPNQKPSVTMKCDKTGQSMYTWGSLTNADSLLPYASKRQFYLRLQNGWQYSIQRDDAHSKGFRGLFGGGNKDASKPKHYSITVSSHSTTVKQRSVQTSVNNPSGSVYATMEQSSPQQNWNILVHARSGDQHDPGIPILLTILLDELHRSRMA